MINPLIEASREYAHTRPFFVGDRVRKKKGYGFPGVVVAVFMTTRGDVRLVVECTSLGVEGMLHIFNPDQMQLDNGTAQ